MRYERMMGLDVIAMGEYLGIPTMNGSRMNGYLSESVRIALPMTTPTSATAKGS
jgi:hypothetical protein